VAALHKGVVVLSAVANLVAPLAIRALRTTQFTLTPHSPVWLCLIDRPQAFQYFSTAIPALQVLTAPGFVICSVYHTKSIRCLKLRFVQKVLCREDTLQTLLVHAKPNIEADKLI